MLYTSPIEYNTQYNNYYTTFKALTHQKQASAVNALLLLHLIVNHM